MKLRPSFQRRGTFVPIVPPNLTYIVEGYSFMSPGGPDTARIVATGDENALWECIPLLGYGVEVLDESGDSAWWGYVHEVRITVGGVEWGVSLDAMANKIAIAYTATDGASGDRRTTAWASDALSTADYGIKELLHTANDLTDAAAILLRDSALVDMAWPMPTTDLGEGDGAQVVFVCKGWVHTLGWRYYANANGVHGYVTQPDQRQPLGDNTVTSVAFTWRLASGSESFDTLGLWVFRNPYGTPVDNLNVEIRDSSRTGALLASFVLTPAEILAVDNGNGGYIEKAIGTTITGNTSTKCVVLSKAGGTDQINHYHIGCTNVLGYPNGSAEFATRLPNGSNFWQPLPYEVTFKFAGKVQTTEQIRTIATAAGQFFTAVDMEQGSGINTVPYRNGDATARTELDALLNVQSAGATRLTYEVTRERRFRVFAEPAQSELWWVDRSMQPYGKSGEKIDKHTCPVGVWVGLKDVLPGASAYSSGAAGFIERSEYNAASGRWVPRFRRNASALDRAMVVQG